MENNNNNNNNNKPILYNLFIYPSLKPSRRHHHYHHDHHHHLLHSPGCDLASSSKCRQRPQPCTSTLQSLQPSFLVSSSTPSVHLDLGRPRLQLPPRFVHNIFLGNPVSSIRATWPAHLSLLDFITLTIFGSL